VELVTGMENLTLAAETRKTSDEGLIVAIDKLTASLNKATQAQTRPSLDRVTEKSGSEASTEYDFDLHTPSTMQNVATDMSSSELERDSFTHRSTPVCGMDDEFDLDELMEQMRKACPK
jgi:hypothetical protein